MKYKNTAISIPREKLHTNINDPKISKINVYDQMRCTFKLFYCSKLTREEIDLKGIALWETNTEQHGAFFDLQEFATPSFSFISSIHKKPYITKINANAEIHTLLAYLRAFKVSSKSLEAGLMQQIIRVLEFPPKESFRSRVILESR